MKRTNSRIKAMINLYHYDLNREMLDQEYLDDLFREENIEVDEDFYQEILTGVLSHLEEINRIINLNLRHWTLERMSLVDRALIRIGVYEMLYTPTPKNIIINEILNLTHIYSELDEAEESKFNNSLLDQIRKSIDGE
jgi:N utilization substance protein B